jgi:hypothetical protein
LVAKIEELPIEMATVMKELQSLPPEFTPSACIESSAEFSNKQCHGMKSLLEPL